MEMRRRDALALRPAPSRRRCRHGEAQPAWAQNFPSKPIRWVIPFPPAGNYDVTSRLVGEAMGRRLGQTVMIDNRPGAGGIVGTGGGGQRAGRRLHRRDGQLQRAVGRALSRRQAVDAAAVRADQPAHHRADGDRRRADGRFADMKAVLAEARAKPGTVSIGHAGNGTTNHVAILRLQVNEKVQFNIIPYKGSGPGLDDLMARQIDLYTDQLTTSLPHIKAGKLRPLLVLSPDRIPQLPDVPSLKDIGSQPFDGGTTAGVFARIETPAPMLDTLNGAVVAALKDESVSPSWPSWAPWCGPRRGPSSQVT